MVDHTIPFQFHHIIQIIRVLDLLPFFFRIHIMDHAKVNIICLQSFQQILKSGTHILHIPCPEILLIFPCGTDVSLNIPLAAVVLNPFPDNISGLRIRHPAVQNIDSLCGRIMDQLNAFLFRMPLQPLSAKADLTDHQPCFSQSSLLHLLYHP